ncbi:hypothetical protein GCM10023321_29010 [Pseudonocardia eucalypti]|uniref:HTH luxR-type domain-containing protein n=1 Tax=Pseudonocardia eucalypti TaxID=648755 RepID=A0ABP9Q3Y1_9PSEU|nr:DNA-binding CsgD family transcriptional regulator [Pseudonocardia eucalypti]
MAAGPFSALDLSLRLATAAHARDDPELAAQDVLGELCAAEPVVAAALVRYDPFTGRHRALCSSYPRPVLDFLRSPAFLVDDVGYRLLRREPERRARGWRDAAVDYPSSRSATRVLRPAGYGGGATARLVTSSGRYVGDLHVSTEAVELPTDELLRALHHAAPLLAASVDVTRRLRLGLGELPPGGRAAVVSPAGEVVPLSDSGDWDEALVGRVLRRRSAGAGEGRFRHLGAGGWLRVKVAGLDSGTLLVVEPDEPAHPLTARELQVLTLITEGLPNAAVARRLDISARTVAHHVEHILHKLAADCRTSAARLAVEQGLRLLPD